MTRDVPSRPPLLHPVKRDAAVNFVRQPTNRSRERCIFHDTLCPIEVRCACERIPPRNLCKTNHAKPSRLRVGTGRDGTVDSRQGNLGGGLCLRDSLSVCLVVASSVSLVRSRACGLRPPSRGTRVLLEKQAHSMQAHLSMVERHRKTVLDCKKTPHAVRAGHTACPLDTVLLDRLEGMPMAFKGTKLVQCVRELPGVLG